MLNPILWKKVQEQKHPGRWEIAERQLPSVKCCLKQIPKVTSIRVLNKMTSHWSLSLHLDSNKAIFPSFFLRDSTQYHHKRPATFGLFQYICYGVINWLMRRGGYHAIMCCVSRRHFDYRGLDYTRVAMWMYICLFICWFRLRLTRITFIFRSF